MKKDNYGINLKINGKDQNFTIDTGSAVTIMPSNPKLYNQKETQPLKKIPGCEQKRNEIPRENIRKHRIERQNYKITKTYHTKKLYYTTTGCTLVKTTTTLYQQNSFGRTQQPIKWHPHKI